MLLDRKERRCEAKDSEDCFDYLSLWDVTFSLLMMITFPIIPQGVGGIPGIDGLPGDKGDKVRIRVCVN